MRWKTPAASAAMAGLFIAGSKYSSDRQAHRPSVFGSSPFFKRCPRNCPCANCSTIFATACISGSLPMAKTAEEIAADDYEPMLGQCERCGESIDEVIVEA